MLHAHLKTEEVIHCLAELVTAGSPEIAERFQFDSSAAGSLPVPVKIENSEAGVGSAPAFAFLGARETASQMGRPL